MEIEFSRNGEGKVLLGLGYRVLSNGNYQKVLSLDDVSDIECKIGDKIPKSEAGKTLVELVFNKNESIDKVIENLEKLKNLNIEKEIVLSETEYCDNESCSCRLPLGC